MGAFFLKNRSKAKSVLQNQEIYFAPQAYGIYLWPRSELKNDVILRIFFFVSKGFFIESLLADQACQGLNVGVLNGCFYIDLDIKLLFNFTECHKETQGIGT